MADPKHDQQRNMRRPARNGSAHGAPARDGGLSFWGKINAVIDEKSQNSVVEPEKIEPGRRLIALGIDFGVAFLIAMVLSCVPFVNRFLVQTLVIPVVMCTRDYLFGGRGIGKNIMGLTVVDMATGGAPSAIQVLTRNAIYLGPVIFLELFFPILHLLQIVPGIGTTPILAVIQPLKETLSTVAGFYVLVIVAIEIYRCLQRDDSMRLGDAIAGTCLTEAETKFSDPLSR